MSEVFNSYHLGHSTTYSWNNFSSPSFNTNIRVCQGLALSPIFSAIYLAPIIKTFKKRIKNLKENIPTDILSFVDDSLLISQKKSYSLSSSFLLCSYNIMKFFSMLALLWSTAKPNSSTLQELNILLIPPLTYHPYGALLSPLILSGDIWVSTLTADLISTCHKLHLVISLPVLRRFPRSQNQLKALKKTFRLIPVTSQSDQ